MIIFFAASFQGKFTKFNISIKRDWLSKNEGRQKKIASKVLKTLQYIDFKVSPPNYFPAIFIGIKPCH
jgi:hypothetical protein